MNPATVIDLRSDTVTKPTAEMRAAMASAQVGDDVYLEDPTVNRLQELAAAIFQKEAALFVPTGTMGNQIAIRLHTKPGQEVVTEVRSHIYNYEMAAMAVVSGVLARPVAAPAGIMDWPSIQRVLSPRIYYRAQTGLIALENTHNMAGGTVYSAERISDICEQAHGAGLPVHLDGARIFNAATALGTTVAELCRPLDSIMCCLSKGLGSPVGSLLIGGKAWIENARSVRKMLGGGMRQAGILAAAGLISLEKMPARLREDHDNARFLAELLADAPGIDLKPDDVRTNILVVGIEQTGITSIQLADRLKREGVLIGTVDPKTIRLLTHYDVDRCQIEQAARIIRRILERR